MELEDGGLAPGTYLPALLSASCRNKRTVVLSSGLVFLI